MRRNLVELLHARHPKLDFPWPECDDGWYELIDRTFYKLQSLDVPLFFTQIKEKYGELRIYLSGSDAAFNITDEAEDESHRICELCGNPGKMCGNHSWWKTLCHTCAEANNYADV